MNIIRFIIAAFVMLVTMFLYDWYVHGALLIEVYNQTEQLWRSPNEMVIYFPFNFGIMIAIAIWFVLVFAYFFPQGGCGSGILLGLFFGVFSGLQAASSYYYLPVGLALAASWFLAHLIKMLICGLLVGAIYRR
jgi:hypothetical protein